jgi:hypothetical protein
VKKQEKHIAACAAMIILFALGAALLNVTTGQVSAQQIFAIGLATMGANFWLLVLAQRFNAAYGLLALAVPLFVMLIIGERVGIHISLVSFPITVFILSFSLLLQRFCIRTAVVYAVPVLYFLGCIVLAAE